MSTKKPDFFSLALSFFLLFVDDDDWNVVGVIRVVCNSQCHVSNDVVISCNDLYFIVELVLWEGIEEVDEVKVCHVYLHPTIRFYHIIGECQLILWYNNTLV